MTITIGSWAIPLAISIGLFVWMLNLPGGGRFREAGNVIMAMIVAVPGSLAAWLIWALVMWWLA